MKINFFTKIGVIMLGMVLLTGVVAYAQDGNSKTNNVPVVVTSPAGTPSAVISGGNPSATVSGGNPSAVVSGGNPSAIVSGDGTNSSGDKDCADGIGLCNPLKVKTIGGLIESAVEIFSYLVIIFAVLAFIWVGLQYILARGNAERMKELSKWLGYIVIGVAVVIGARVIVSIVINTLSSTGVVDERVIQQAKDANRVN